MVSQNADAFPAGTIMAYVGAIADIPKGWAVCDGSTVNGIQTPNLSGRFLEGPTNAANARKTKEAGLPNITATFGSINCQLLPADGANSIPSYAYRVAQGTSWTTGAAFLDASKASPVYGKSSTVQPSSYTVVFIMKVK